MKAQTFLDEVSRLQRELHRLNSKAEPTDGTETFISRAGSYISGHPYLWSSDARRAFIFRDREQAARILLKYPVVLKGARVGQFRPRAVDGDAPEAREVRC